MRAENHDFVLQVRARQQRAHVAGFLDFGRQVHVDPPADLERERLEAWLFRRCDRRIQVQAGGLEQLPAAVFVEPALHREFIGIFCFGIVEGQVSFQVPIDADVPSIAGRGRIVQHQAAGRALPAGLLELVQPSAVIGHVPAAEQGRVIVAGIVDHRDDDLAPDVDIGIIVPVVLRRVDAEAAEDVFRRWNRHFLSRPRSPDDQVVGIAEFRLAAALGHDFPADRPAGDGNHPERLGPAAVERRLQPQPRQLLLQIPYRQVLVGCHRLPASEFIRGDGLDPFANGGFIILVRDKALCGGLRDEGRRKQGNHNKTSHGRRF